MVMSAIPPRGIVCGQERGRLEPMGEILAGCAVALHVEVVGVIADRFLTGRGNREGTRRFVFHGGPSVSSSGILLHDEVVFDFLDARHGQGVGTGRKFLVRSVHKAAELDDALDRLDADGE
jgi:hypothetical protein